MKLLIDANLSEDLLASFRRLGGRAEILHLRQWHGGSLVDQHNQSDVPWLRLAGGEKWVVVTDDRNTLLGDLGLLSRQGGPNPGVAIVPKGRQRDIGWIARKLLLLEAECKGLSASEIQRWL